MPPGEKKAHKHKLFALVNVRMALGQTAGCPRVNRAKKFMCSPRNTGNINFSFWLTGGLSEGCPDFHKVYVPFSCPSALAKCHLTSKSRLVSFFQYGEVLWVEFKGCKAREGLFSGLTERRGRCEREFGLATFSTSLTRCLSRQPTTFISGCFFRFLVVGVWPTQRARILKKTNLA